MPWAPSTTSYNERLAQVRDFLQGFAEWAEWATSGKAWMTIAQYQDWQRREIMKEKKEMLYELKRRKWIETKTIGRRLAARLTEAGWQMALRDRIRKENTKCQDGLCCFLIFDIPESERYARKLLRQFIKECNFVKLQKSVWVTDKDVAQLLLVLLQRRKLDRWVRIIEGRILQSSPLNALRALTQTTTTTSPNHQKHTRNTRNTRKVRKSLATK